ncbi:hypothetical protein C6P45_005333 [Maudiozyma exigua]|uniref:GYF domain-containing protein n=1 Tax=Maudiozyma exigua TaxID=34358 RepID=A0A9P6WAQ0_MAUEX|nr:hypothetical protein C6P45_005333 [Kazachstania exigua]
MNSDNFNQDPLSYQFQNLQFNPSGNNNPAVNSPMAQHPLLGNRVPLSRTTSMGIQRSSSPFANNSGTLANDPLLNQSATQHSQSALFNSWKQHDSVSSTPTTLHPALATQAPVVANPNATSVFNQQHNPSAHTLLQMQQPNNPQINPLPPGQQIQSQWKYKDMQNNIQGPFDSQTMTNWYSSNYFQPDLSLCRLGTTYEPLGINDRFITLSELASLAQNVKDPFGGFDHMVTMFNNSNFNPTANAMNNIVNTNNVLPRVSNFFPVANTEEEKTEDDGTSLAERINKAREALTPEANINSGDFTQDEIFNLTFTDGSFYHEVNVPVPVNRKHVKKIEPTTIINTDVHLAQAEANAKREQRIAEEKRRQDKAEKAARLLLEEQEKADRDARKREEVKLQKKQKKLKEQQDKAAKKEKKKLNQKQKLEAIKASERQKLEAVRASERQKQRDEKNDIRTELEIVQPEAATPLETVIPAVSAPWANKTANTTTIPKINLREQASLAQKKLDEKESRERQRALMLNNQILQEQQEENNRKAMLTWASKPATKQTPVSIDIKSQLTKTTPKKQSQSQLPVKSNEPLEDPSFIEEQKKIWEQVQRNNKGKSAATTSSSSGGAWNTVTKKSNTNADKNGTLKPVGHSISVPSLKKPVIAAATNHYPGNASISARQEFLKWCKSQMRLNPGISMNSVLEVLLSLPSGPIANEIIADTIYSNSSVMDGRRFATEFTKRRTQCEKQVKDPLSWSEALALPEGNDDDWEFQVVSKKKGRKH